MCYWVFLVSDGAAYSLSFILIIRKLLLLCSGLFSHIGLAVIPVIDISIHREIGTLSADRIQRFTNKTNINIPELEFSNFSLMKEDMR